MSFAQIVKREVVSNISKKKRCCLISFLYSLIYFSKLENDNFIIKTADAENQKNIIDICDFISSKAKLNYSVNNGEILINKDFLRFSTFVEIRNNIFKCEECQNNFLKAVFVLRGTINSPEKSRRLEFVFKDKNDSDAIFELMSNILLEPKRSTRQGKYILYLKDSEKIEDFLALIGAKNAYFDFMNSEIEKQMRNNANRVANCDSANISKSIQASQRYIDIINELIENKKIDLLSEELKETALKRAEFKELNLKDLGHMLNPPVSKSGVHHRLEKIVEFYENLDK